MKIAQVTIKNYEAIEFADVETNGQNIILAGGNGQGKSSFIRACRTAFGGKRQASSIPVRRGADEAVIDIDCKDFTIHCELTPSGGYDVKVTDANGFEQKPPQRFLDQFHNSMFDLMEFINNKKDRKGVLEKLIGLDFTDHDANRANIYAQRTTINAKVKETATLLNNLDPVDEGVPEPVSVADLVGQMQEANTKNQDADHLRRLQENDRIKLARISDTVMDLEEKLEEAKVVYQAAQSAVNTHQEIPEPTPTDALQAQIATAEEVNERARVHAEREENRACTAATHENYLQASRDASDELRRLDDLKAQQISDADLPVEGLGFTDDDVTYEGLPFDQASDGDKLVVSAAIGMRTNPELRTMFVQGGEHLDPENLTRLVKLAADESTGEEDGYQLIMENRVAGDRVTHIMENGQATTT